MNLKSKKMKWLVSICALFTLNTLTYYILGPSQLKNELLTGSFAHLSHKSDSALVRFYCLSECPRTVTGWTYNLWNEEKLLKERLAVHYVSFPDPRKDDRSDYGRGVSYETENTVGGFLDVLRLFCASQREILSVDHKYNYERNVQYHWCFFFWIKTFEFFRSDDLYKKANRFFLREGLRHFCLSSFAAKAVC